HDGHLLEPGGAGRHEPMVADEHVPGGALHDERPVEPVRLDRRDHGAEVALAGVLRVAVEAVDGDELVVAAHNAAHRASPDLFSAVFLAASAPASGAFAPSP